MDVISNIENFFGNTGLEIDKSQQLFDRMADLIIGLDPDCLTDIQLQEVMDILQDIEFSDEPEISEQTSGRKYRLASKSTPKTRQYARKYYRRNRVKIKKKRVLFKRSAEGRKRKRVMQRMAKQHKTPTGRRKVRYRRVVKKAKPEEKKQ